MALFSFNHLLPTAFSFLVFVLSASVVPFPGAFWHLAQAVHFAAAAFQDALYCFSQIPKRGKKPALEKNWDKF